MELSYKPSKKKLSPYESYAHNPQYVSKQEVKELLDNATHKLLNEIKESKWYAYKRTYQIKQKNSQSSNPPPKLEMSAQIITAFKEINGTNFTSIQSTKLN